MNVQHSLLTRASALVESCFEQAKEFIPERWYSKPEMIKNKSAYAPFALGLPFVQPSLNRKYTHERVQAVIAASAKIWPCRN